MRTNDVDLDIQAVEQPSVYSQALPSSPSESHTDPSRAPRDGCVAGQHAGRLAAFDDALQTPPRRERQSFERVRRRLRRVEDHKAEVARLKHERERFDRSIEGALIHV